MHVTYPEGNISPDKALILFVRLAHRAQAGKLYCLQQLCKRISEVPHLLDPVTWVTEVNCLSHVRKQNVPSIVKTIARSRCFRQGNYLTVHMVWRKKYITHPLRKSWHNF